MSQNNKDRSEQRRSRQPQRPVYSEPRHAQRSPHINNLSMPLPYPESEAINLIVVQDGRMDGEMDVARGPEDSNYLTIGSSDIGSYGDNGTSCAFTDETNSSWLVVPHHHRTYSNESSGPVSEGPCHSDPSDSQPDHLYGAEFAVDTTADNEPIPEHNGHHFIQDLARPETQPSYLTPDITADGCNGLDYYEATEHYTFQYLDPPGTSESIYGVFRPYSDAEPSWNPLERRVPQYDPGFAGFAPRSPSESLVNESSPKKSKPRKPERGSSSRGKQKTFQANTSTNLGWEITVIRKDGLQTVSENIQQESNQRTSGCRRGKLLPENRDKAQRVRKLGACWRCWVLKVPCSEGDICDRCKKQISKCSPRDDQLCFRNGFSEYEELFFPEYLHEHLDRRRIKRLLSEHITHFTDTTINVEVSTGEYFEPMHLSVNVFEPKPGDWELRRLHHVTPEPEDSRSQLAVRYSAPVGLLGFSLSENKDICHDHIQKMIANPWYAWQTAGDPTSVQHIILKAILEYQALTSDHLLGRALQLHACQYFMGMLVTFTEASGDEVHQKLEWEGIPRAPHLSSRLLNRQIKYAMHKLQREITREVLDGLEKLMRSRTRDAWGPTFCTILLLCFCIEGIQTAAETFIVCDIEKSQIDFQTAKFNQEHCFTACKNLDTYPYQQTTTLFNEIFRTQRRREAFNPLRSLRESAITGLEGPADLMAQSIFSTFDSCPEIYQLCNNPTLVTTGVQVQPAEIKANNTGRLASKFLMSFFS